MTMHLMSHAYTTTNTKKRKTSNRGVDEYVQYRQGNYKPKLRGTPLPDYQVSDHRQKYPSGDGIGVTFARKENTYTGTLIKGIATMHKSNAVPIMNDEQAIEVARMRRG